MWVLKGSGAAIFPPVTWRAGWLACRDGEGRSKDRRQRKPRSQLQIFWEPLGARRHPWTLKLHFLFLLKLTWVCFCYFQPKRTNQHSLLERGRHGPAPNLTASPKQDGAGDPMSEGSWLSRSAGRKRGHGPHWVSEAEPSVCKGLFWRTWDAADGAGPRGQEGGRRTLQ